MLDKAMEWCRIKHNYRFKQNEEFEAKVYNEAHGNQCKRSDGRRNYCAHIAGGDHECDENYY